MRKWSGLDGKRVIPPSHLLYYKYMYNKLYSVYHILELWPFLNSSLDKFAISCCSERNHSERNHSEHRKSGPITPQPASRCYMCLGHHVGLIYMWAHFDWLAKKVCIIMFVASSVPENTFFSLENTNDWDEVANPGNRKSGTTPSWHLNATHL